MATAGVPKILEECCVGPIGASVGHGVAYLVSATPGMEAHMMAKSQQIFCPQFIESMRVQFEHHAEVAEDAMIGFFDKHLKTKPEPRSKPN